jgi:hypothetical protein
MIPRQTVDSIDIKNLQNRLLKVFYMCPLLVPAFQGEASSFLFFFAAAAINSTNEANKAGSMLR